MYMTVRSRMSSIMELIGPELSELSALELENLLYLTLLTLASANIDQSVPNLATVYLPTRSRLFAVEFGKVAKYDFVYSLSSTNIDQSAPNLVKMYVIIRSRMSLIMDLIGQELSELSALKLENLPYLTVNTLASANIDQSIPNLATIYMRIRSWMSLIMGQIQPEHPELIALEFRKFPEYGFVYILSSTNIDLSAQNFVKMYVIIRSRMSLIMDLIRPELS